MEFYINRAVSILIIDGHEALRGFRVITPRWQMLGADDRMWIAVEFDVLGCYNKWCPFEYNEKGEHND